MKLIIESLGYPSALAGKPVALLGVAGGTIGAVKSLEHLRSVVSHVGGIVLLLPISVANVRTVFDDEGRCLDSDAERLIRSVGTHLLTYIEHHVCPESDTRAAAQRRRQTITEDRHDLSGSHGDVNQECYVF